MSTEPRRVAMINSDGKSAPTVADPPGVETTLHDLRLRLLARTPYEHLVTELGTLDAVERAVAAGCDAVYVDTFGDYAVDRARAATSVPVVGAGEESIKFAATLYAGFSVVTVWPRSMGYLYADRLRSTPGGERCRGVHHLSGDDELDRVGRPDGVKSRMRRQEADVLTALADLCRRAVAADGSDAVLLGCTCMAPAADAVAAQVDVPVLEPSAIGLTAAHAAALSGTHTPPSTGVARHTGLATGLVDACLAAGGASSPGTDDCEVCIVHPVPTDHQQKGTT
ncbi:aspartate/glutamate racemase family protein [Nocardioides sp. TF02-7]|uniref:aspartate/glutamate racemase family protein n=1 Tax=Nocardioides sp. TF02-7 TaxID=2917724 RepID=UPI001F05A984|nr:aspartate/glutamate racemase family protein [Nocardioides sp. TF02-7]UMG93686.1 aspartate/glutamate racemase family protein [Nocardioides sp. TF02-7]